MYEAQYQIRIPPQALVVLAGIAGSGKTTFAQRHFPVERIFSLDAIRGWITGDPGNQSRNELAVTLLYQIIEARMLARVPTVVDTTATTSARRRALVRRAQACERPAILILIEVDPVVAAARQDTRPPNRRVPLYALERQQRELEADRAQIPTEGWTAAYVIEAGTMNLHLVEEDRDDAG